MNLWVFGDSHVAGHELGVSNILEKKFYLSLGKKYNSHDDLMMLRQKNIGKYKQVVERWNQVIKNHYDPSLSYAGILAKMLGLNLICKAIPGASLNGQIKKLKEENINWNKDLVLFGIPNEWRWLDYKGLDQDIHRVPERIQKVLYNWGPGEHAAMINHVGCLCYLHMNFPKIVLIKQNNDFAFNHYNISKEIHLNSISLRTMAEGNCYPGGHFKEEEHQKFAIYIMDLLKEKGIINDSMGIR